MITILASSPCPVWVPFLYLIALNLSEPNQSMSLAALAAAAKRSIAGIDGFKNWSIREL